MQRNDSLNNDLSDDQISHHEKLLGQSKRLESKDTIMRNWSIDFGKSSEEGEKKRIGSSSSQFMALIRKSFALQAKQRGTNVCQILTPIVCLLFVLLIKTLLAKPVDQKFSFELPFPFIYNVPYDKVYGQDNLLLPDNVTSPLKINNCLQWYMYDFEGADADSRNFVDNEDFGMLSNILPPFLGSDLLYECRKLGPMPYFKKPKNGTIDENLYNNLVKINKLNLNTSSGEVSDLRILPDGAVTFYEANDQNLTLKLQINDLRLFSFHRDNGVTKYKANLGGGKVQSVLGVQDGQLILLDMITKSYAQSIIDDDIFLMSGSQVMPMTTSGDAIMSNLMNIVGATLYPIALSLLLPVFMYGVVVEKEERLREIMKMSGLKIANYWAANYVWCTCMYVVSTFIFNIFGKYILAVDFFTKTNPLILILTFLGWGLSQVSLSFFFQNFIAKSKTAIIAGYLISLWTTIFGVSFSVGVYPSPQKFPFLMIIYPPFAFTRLMYHLCLKCGSFQCVASFSELNEEMVTCIKVLFIGALVFFILGLYLDEVLPKEYGVKKHPLFFIKALFSRKSKAGQNPFAKDHVKINQGSMDAKSEVKKNLFNEDNGVQEEKAFVEVLQPPFYRCPLVIKNLRKVYNAIGGKPAKIAVEDFSLHIKKGETFGLLGPNGAGKTSLIAMLTGLYPPESGNAWIGGYSIIDQIDNVHTQIGVCPQFDLLWPDLTVEEHLLFYSRIRGIPSKQEKAVVKKAMTEVYLTKFASFQTKQLSGGMKRRLSVALALVGDPKIVYLDEPTTGLDPENRRQLWNILSEARGNKAMVLTTHSMEEADVLCTRIGIMTDGSIQCIGTQTKLKSKYGGGYHLFVNCYKENYVNDQINQTESQVKRTEKRYERVQKYVKELLPRSQIKSSFNGNFIFLVPIEGLEVSKVFQDFESKKVELEISDWGISQSTLEDVFMEIVEASEAVEDDLQ